MLKEILNLIDKTGYISTSQLASELKTSEDMIDMALGQLKDLGYLVESKSTSCSSSCGNCPYSKNCNKTLVRSFSISNKAKKILKD